MVKVSRLRTALLLHHSKGPSRALVAAGHDPTPDHGRLSICGKLVAVVGGPILVRPSPDIFLLGRQQQLWLKLWLPGRDGPAATVQAGRVRVASTIPLGGKNFRCGTGRPRPEHYRRQMEDKICAVAWIGVDELQKMMALCKMNYTQIDDAIVVVQVFMKLYTLPSFTPYSPESSVTSCCPSRFSGSARRLPSPFAFSVNTACHLDGSV